MARSRRSKRVIKQTERNLIFIGLGLFILLVILIFFGVKLLVGFSLLVEKKDSESLSDAVSQELLTPPILDETFSATNEASLNISGFSESGDTVSLFRDGIKIKTADIHSDRSFLFKNISLELGSNAFKARTSSKSKKESKFSETITVSYSTTAPTLTIDFPTDNETYHKDSNPIKIRGETDPENDVTVNGFRAIVSNDGSYSYNLSLQSGENQITIEATDEAGNKIQKQIKISYSE